MNLEIMTIPQNMLNVLKQELGFGDKEMPSLNMNEKVCVYFLRFFLWLGSIDLPFVVLFFFVPLDPQLVVLPFSIMTLL